MEPLVAKPETLFCTACAKISLRSQRSRFDLLKFRNTGVWLTQLVNLSKSLKMFALYFYIIFQYWINHWNRLKSAFLEAKRIMATAYKVLLDAHFDGINVVGCYKEYL